MIKVGDNVYRLMGSLGAWNRGIGGKPKHAGVLGEVLKITRQTRSGIKFKDARVRVRWANGHEGTTEECRLITAKQAREHGLES